MDCILSIHYGILLIFILNTLCLIPSIESSAVQLDSSNFDKSLENNELVFLNFYADWCRFSNLLSPIWDETAEKVKEKVPEEGRVLIGKVDCDSESSISQRFHISKYPTLKLVRYGQLVKREYRGSRSAEAFATFVVDQLKDPITEFTSQQDLQGQKTSKRVVIGYFENKEVAEYANLKKVAIGLKDDCDFFVGFGEAGGHVRPPESSLVVFREKLSDGDAADEVAYEGNMGDYEELNRWSTEHCVPLVREITFENAEELTEEGLPFLILFHKPDDTDIVKKYRELIDKQLISEKQNVNFLTADGKQFAHPLHHLGKSQDDLPLIAIDSFRHMYLFPDVKDMETPGKLLKFLQDLYSGKLHREFHYGPDPSTTEEATETTEEEAEAKAETKSGEEDPGHIKRTAEPKKDPKKPTSPPESTFKKLMPSNKRYTLLDKIEL